MQTRSKSPFFLTLDEGAVTPMTIIATTELTDCEYICGTRKETQEAIDNPDRCVAVAGTVGDSDLTIMRYCVPSMPGAGVRKDDKLVWIAEGTLNIMNLVVDVRFTDFARGESLVLLRDVGEDTKDVSGSRSRIDAIVKGAPKYVVGMTQPMESTASMQRVLENSMPVMSTNTGRRIMIGKIVGIEVQPATPHPILYTQLLATVTTGIPDPVGDFMDGGGESSVDKRFSVCGSLTSYGRRWSMQVCKSEIWDEADRGHIVWLENRRFAVVPGGSLLATGSGHVRIMDMGTGTLGKPELVLMKPFQSTSWTLTSGIPATTRALDFSSTTRSLVRKTPRVSQTGRVVEGISKMEVFMSNDPSSPTHWLSQIRLDLQGNAALAGVHQSSEVMAQYTLLQKCDYQVLLNTPTLRHFP